MDYLPQDLLILLSSIFPVQEGHESKVSTVKSANCQQLCFVGTGVTILGTSPLFLRRCTTAILCTPIMISTTSTTAPSPWRVGGWAHGQNIPAATPPTTHTATTCTNTHTQQVTGCLCKDHN